MKREHLSTDRLLALHRGDVGDFAALEHLASCPDCRRAFDDTRWFLLLSRLPGLIAAGSHPGADELMAYHTYALASARVAEIRQHLRSCESCMALAGRARSAERSLRYVSPGRLTVQSTMKGFRSRPLRRLGTIVVALIGKALQLTYVPEPAVAGESVLRQTLGVRELRSPTHPSSALGRARRLSRRRDKPPDEETRTRYGPGWRWPIRCRRSASKRKATCPGAV